MDRVHRVDQWMFDLIKTEKFQTDKMDQAKKSFCFQYSYSVTKNATDISTLAIEMSTTPVILRIYISK